MFGHNVFDLAGEDVEPAGDDHVLGPVDDVVEAVLVFAGQVSGVHPAVFEGLGRRVGQVPVPAGQQRARYADLADLTLGYRLAVVTEQRHPREQRRPPAGRQPLLVVVLLGQIGDHHRRLGLPVVLREDGPEPADRLLQPHRIHRRRAVIHRFQRRQVAGVGVGMVHQRIDHRRHQHRRGDLLLLDHLEHFGRIELGHHPQLATLDDDRGEERRPGMRERGAHQEPWVLRPFPLGQLHGGHRRDRLCRPHHALGLSGGAAGVGQPADVIGRQIGRGQRLGRVLRRLGRQIDRGHPAVGEFLGDGTDGEHLLERRHLLHQSQRAFDEHRLRIDDQRRHLGIGEHIGVVVQGAERVQRGAAIPLGLARADDHQHLGPIEREQPDRGTGAGAERLEGLDVLTDAVGEFATGHRGVPEEQHRLVFVALERADGQVAGVQRMAQQVTHGLQTRTCSNSSHRVLAN